MTTRFVSLSPSLGGLLSYKIMRNKIIKLTLRIVSFFLLGHRYKNQMPHANANLGCGLRCAPGWINIDGSLTALFGSRHFSSINRILYVFAGSSAHYSFAEFDAIIKQADLKFFDLRQDIPFSDQSVDVIYASHFLEHLTKLDGKRFLGGCVRVLKRNGLLRIAVPNLDTAMDMYKKGETERMLDLFFYTSEHYDFHMHKYNYNFELLKSFLKEAGFTKVERKEYQKGECPDIGFLDVYPENSLYVEATK